MNILIADDEKNLRSSLADYLSMEGFKTATAENGFSAQKALEDTAFDCAVIDLKMPGMGGLDLLSWINDQGPSVPVIMMSAFGDIEDAVAAMKKGARDYITKPFDPEELAIRIRKAVEEHRLKMVHRQDDFRTSPDWSSRNEKMRSIYALAEKAARTDTTVLITGESGTGKEILARMIHGASTRAQGPFIPVNIAGIPDTLIESELFGYEKGAFTGADRRKEGLFEAAAGGTIFLDEIGDAPGHLQVKLLRVLQDRKVQRLGGTGIIPVDLRLLAATNRDLEAMVKAGTFREDLFYRLNVIRLSLPPLRERPEDLPELASLLLEKVSRRVGKPARGITGGALAKLAAYSFPGNIRELENLLERAVILSDTDTVNEDALDLPVSTNRNNAPLRGTLEEIEKKALLDALYRHEGRRNATAEELGITRRTLLNKIKTYGLSEFLRS
ncbi:MAG: sigma-54-dependent Fis family transcriptional regulator [Spirochaetales bacterium]|nr:sigma-54-dependent Fis family transcriptional regulator [Spirochaetales bacterium]